MLSLVVQPCLTPCHPMDYSPSGSSVHGDPPSKNIAVGCHALLKINYASIKKKKKSRDFPGGPEVKTLLPMQIASV